MKNPDKALDKALDNSLGLAVVNTQMTVWLDQHRGYHGLNNFYDVRGSMLTATDVELAAAVVRGGYSRPLEIAAGLAQVSHAVAAMASYARCTAVEIDVWRFRAALSLRRHLNSDVALFRGSWQNITEEALGFAPDLVFCGNATSSHCAIHMDLPRFRYWLERGASLIFNPSLYGKKDENRKLDSADFEPFRIEPLSRGLSRFVLVKGGS